MPELRARAVAVRRDGVRALDGIDLDVAAGELVAVMGGTGAGKSTLALALCGLVALEAGQVAGDGARDARLVLQRPEATFLADRVLDEVALAAIARGVPEAAAHHRAQALLDELGLPADVAARDPLTLSGGEQRRVAIAAVLAAEPRVLVLDEPGAGLDRAARRELHDVLRTLHAAGRTIVLVTHDPDEAAALATRLVVLDAGRIAWDGGCAQVLGAPEQARSLGLAVAPEVAVLQRVAAARGVVLTRAIARSDEAIDAIAAMLEGGPGAVAVPRTSTASQVAARRPSVEPLAPLAPLVDARLRLVACAVAVVAALLATSLLAATVVVVAAAVVVRAARIARARVRLATRPLVALAVLLVGLQLLFGGPQQVAVAPGVDTTWPAASAVLRTLQASAIVLATLALSAATAPGDLATGMRRMLAPLALVRVPIGSLAFVVATGLGLVPAFADELERLRLAQRARGIRREPASVVARLRLDAGLIGPLFVASFRRAHLLADALAVRGVDPDVHPADWRARRTPGGDAALLVVAVALLAMTRFA